MVGYSLGIFLELRINQRLDMKKHIFDFELAQGINSRRSVKELLYSLKLCKSILKHSQQRALEYSHEVALLEHELSKREKEKTKENISLVK